MSDAFTDDEFDQVDDIDDAEKEAAGAGAVPAAPGSTLAGLRARVAAAKQTLHIDYAVPRLDPPVFVRYKPTTQNRLNAASKVAGKMRSRSDGDIIANAGILVDACVGVFEVIDGQEVSIDPDDREGDWPRFGPRLAELLGVSTNKASDVVRALYLTDGDIMSTVTNLGIWSGYAQEELERDPEGN